VRSSKSISRFLSAPSSSAESNSEEFETVDFSAEEEAKISDAEDDDCFPTDSAETRSDISDQNSETNASGESEHSGLSSSRLLPNDFQDSEPVSAVDALLSLPRKLLSSTGHLLSPSKARKFLEVDEEPEFEPELVPVVDPGMRIYRRSIIELSQLTYQYTLLKKVRCLDQTTKILISEMNTWTTSEYNMNYHLSAAELIPLFAYVLVKVTFFFRFRAFFL
jgi:hypothetical protein